MRPLLMAPEIWQRNKLGAILAIFWSLIFPKQIKAELYLLREDGTELGLSLLQVYIAINAGLSFWSQNNLVCTILKRSQSLVVVFEKSLNSVKVFKRTWFLYQVLKSPWNSLSACLHHTIFNKIRLLHWQENLAHLGVRTCKLTIFAKTFSSMNNILFLFLLIFQRLFLYLRCSCKSCLMTVVILWSLEHKVTVF